MKLKFSECLDWVEVTDSITGERSYQETLKPLVCLKWLDKSALTKDYLFICDLRRDFDRKRHSKEYRQMTEKLQPIKTKRINRNTLSCAYKEVQCKASPFITGCSFFTLCFDWTQRQIFYCFTSAFPKSYIMYKVVTWAKIMYFFHSCKMRRCVE